MLIHTDNKVDLPPDAQLLESKLTRLTTKKKGTIFTYNERVAEGLMFTDKHFHDMITIKESVLDED